MNTSLKVILTAVGIAILVSPVMAESRQNGSNSHAVPANARGSAAHIVMHRVTPATSGEAYRHVHVQDCIRTTFPQCGGN